MFDKIKSFFEKAWKWILAVWDKHDEQLSTMVENILPLVIAMAGRSDLSGEEKRKAVLDHILDNAEIKADDLAKSMINEAIEVAANRYNIQLGKMTIDKMDKAAEAVIKAARDFANGKLELSGQEAQEAAKVSDVFLSENKS